jgi:riboflavin kinase/FMN adenylyltransferase
MKIYEKLDTTAKISDNSEIICIGAFDGAHLAHQELFKKTRDLNKQFDIVTFDVLPKIYFNDSLKPLVSKKERSKIFETFRPKNLIYLNFEQFNRISSGDFCTFLHQNLGIKKIVVGKDFKFGKNRSGDINSLIDSFGEDNIFLLEDFLINNEKVSSTKLRYYLSSGEVDKANNLLGRDYSLTGKVKKGKQLGSELGFPTANLTLDEEVFLPTFGVYYGVVEVDKKRFNCIANIGLNPTVDDEDSVKIEAHILNFNDDIYHKEIKLFLKNFIRDEQKFETIDELKNQVLDDIESAKKYI